MTDTNTDTKFFSCPECGSRERVADQIDGICVPCYDGDTIDNLAEQAEWDSFQDEW